jgi:hypothetical protein
MACYNGGNLVGEWWDAVEAPLTMEEFDTDVSPLPDDHTAEGHEELWCYDTEGMPVRDEMSPSTAKAWADLFTEVDDSQHGALTAYIRSQEIKAPADVTVSEFEDAYAGEVSRSSSFRPDEEFAQSLWEDTRDGPAITEWPYSCIDWEYAARELMYEFNKEEVGDVTYYFHNC